MCGRFTQISSPKVYAELFGISTDLSSAPRYNIAPSSDVLACRVSLTGVKELVPLHWGLVPSWSKGLDKRFSMINARAESVATKPAYRAPFRHHRCLIPVDGFYEWHSEGEGKQPYYIYQANRTPLALAGLWDHWDDGEGDKIESCTIITTEANSFMQPIHERMPVILKAEVFDSWLNNDEPNYLQGLLQPYAEIDLEMIPVSHAVNNPRNDSAALIVPEGMKN
jgi:putative SOS response-associated peptidase YedK